MANLGPSIAKSSQLGLDSCEKRESYQHPTSMATFILRSLPCNALTVVFSIFPDKQQVHQIIHHFHLHFQVILQFLQWETTQQIIHVKFQNRFLKNVRKTCWKPKTIWSVERSGNFIQELTDNSRSCASMSSMDVVLDFNNAIRVSVSTNHACTVFRCSCCRMIKILRILQKPPRNQWIKVRSQHNSTSVCGKSTQRSQKS